MANGVWDLDYSQIAGAQQGGQNLQSTMNYLLDRLSQQGQFGQDAYVGGEGMPSYMQTGGNPYDPYNLGGDDSYEDFKTLSPDNPFYEYGKPSAPGESLQGMQGYLDWYASKDKEGALGQGMGALQRMLQDLNLGELSKGYRQDIGSIGSEIESQIGGLKKGYGTRQKTSRYGNIGSGGRNLAGSGRRQYMSDIYGLRQQQQELTRGAQKGLEGDFYDKVGRLLSFSPPPEYEDEG